MQNKHSCLNYLGWEMKTVRHSNLLMQECYNSVAFNKGSWKCYMYHMIISTDNKLKWVHKPGINDVSSDEKIYCLLSKPCWVVLYVKQVLKEVKTCIPILSLLSFLNHVHDELWCLLCVWREKCSPASVLLPEQLYNICSVNDAVSGLLNWRQEMNCGRGFSLIMFTSK